VGGREGERELYEELSITGVLGRDIPGYMGCETNIGLF